MPCNVCLLATVTDDVTTTKKRLTARTLTRLKGKYPGIVNKIQHIIDEKSLISSNLFCVYVLLMKRI